MWNHGKGRIDCMFEFGAEIVIADFHMHTRKDKEFVYKVAENSFVSDYIDAMDSKKIRIGIITNHNKFDLGEYKALRKEAQKRDILILPGVELFIKEGSNGLHTLIAFNPTEWIEGGNNYIESFLNIVFRDISNRENENTRCTTDLNTTLSELEKYNRDYFVVFAHIDQNNGLVKECDGGMIQSLASNPVFKKRVLGVQKARSHDNIANLISWLKYKPALLDGSDPKQLNDIGKKGGFSYIKIGELSYSALKYALQDDDNRVFPSDVQFEHSCIRAVTFQGGKLNESKIGFSPQLNTFIGIRGSGKSAVLEALRYGLQIDPFIDAEYKNNLVKYVLESGGKVVISITDEHGKNYEVRRISGENPSILDHNGNDLAIPVASIIRNPLYFGQKDLALTETGYEFKLLNKLVGTRLINKDGAVSEQVDALIEKIRLFNSIAEIPAQIAELEEKQREIDHKLKIFEEKGIAGKLEKQTSCNYDSIKLNDILKEVNKFNRLLYNFLVVYNADVISLSGYTSKYNPEIFQKAQQKISSFNTNMANINKSAKAIEEDINALNGVQKELTATIEALKEEFAEIRRDIHDNSLDVDSFGKYQTQKAQLKSDIERQRRELTNEVNIRAEIVSCIRKRNDILLEIFNAYKTEIDRINASQPELQISISFKGDKNKFEDQLKTVFKGTGINETKYNVICSVFPDMVAIVQDVLMDNGKQLRLLLTSQQYEAVFIKIRENFESLVKYRTENLVEISYHGKPLNQHSIGQRASALVLFILSQNDNDVIIIDQPEDDLDNQVIYTEFIKKLKEKKFDTQFIFATHNANIPVLGDAERIIAADSTDGNMHVNSGTIDSTESHQQIVDIMEGGYEAFQRRNEIYTSWGN